jgi:hypothetical protein
MAEGQWFYTRGGQQAGPVSLDQLRQMAASGQITPADLVWREGMANWQPMGSVPELGGAPAAPAPAAPYGQPHGTPVPPYPVQMPYGQAPPGYSGLAIGGFVCSLLGLLCFGPLFGIIAIILGGIALSGMNRVGNPKGKGLAIAALIIGVLDIVFGIVGIIYFVRHPGANPFSHMRKF